MISGMKTSALAVDTERLEEFCFRFQEHSDHVQEVTRHGSGVGQERGRDGETISINALALWH